MNEPESLDFEEAAQSFLGYEQKVRGHVRYYVTRRNLEGYLGDEPLRVIDVQGGSGSDAAWLATLGHHVTLLEANPTQLAFAEERLKELKDEEQKRIKIQPGALSDVTASAGTYDLALCHGVAMYMDDPTKYLSQVFTLVKPGGIVSVLEKGLRGARDRATREHRRDQLRQLRREQRFINHANREVYAFRPQQLYDLLHNSNIEVLQWAGVRIYSDEDERPIANVSDTELRKIEKNEYSDSWRHRARGQMLHFIGRKRQPNVQQEEIAKN